MKMNVPGAQRRPNLWRLNEELIQYKKDEEIIRKEIEQYFIINDTKEISDSTLWEAHKAQIRGILIAIGARKKRENKKHGTLNKRNT